APNMDSDMMSADITFPSYDVPVNIETFPGLFYVDVNNDGKRDFIAAPNSYTNSNNTDGTWLYLNEGTDTTPVFNFNQSGFLQNEMIERGEGALPVFFDYDNDGLTDLVVANYGFFVSGGTYSPQLALYKNVGTATNPTYNLVNSDFGNLYAALGVEGLYPTFGDLDNDGDKDMVVGDKDGHLHYFTNTAGASAPAAFTLTTPLMTDNTSSTIDVGQYATPLLVDLNRDGDLDLVVGRQLATLWYYENTGTVTAPVFTLTEDTLGGIDVSESWTPVGYSVPAIYDNAGDYVLFVGSQKGVLYQYDNIDGNLTGDFNRVDSLGHYNKVGGRIGAAIDKLNADGLPDLIIGNYRGGLSLYYGATGTPGSVTEQQHGFSINVYPNPVNTQLTIRTHENGNYQYTITDISGKSVLNGGFNGNSGCVDMQGLANGMYVLQLRNDLNQTSTQKLVKFSLN
ncbi:MAG TPA: T9SS type A sorting domain-containing protein, partial [Flavobacteriales bacterium]|nr:T9SS type A sorting domain-containing protein [Flavobacteriales bacterium]